MAQSENEQPKGDATDFIKLQRDLDKAKNERQKSSSDENTDQPTTKTDVSQKKTGGGKQISPGT